MIGKLKSMLGFSSRKLERPKPDQITADIVIARQRNERASEKARVLLKEVLDENDRIRGSAI